MHIPTSFTSTKALGACIASVLLAITATFVNHDNYGPLSLAVVGLYTTFAASNTVSGILNKPDTTPTDASK